MSVSARGGTNAIHVIALLVSALFIGAIDATAARAQTWSSTRGRPLLWQITSVDATGEAAWPYGAEDVAGDGAAAFDADEAGADLRTVYADANADRLWLRAYVASESSPAESVAAYFFIDADANASTGGAAESELWPELEPDPTPGGYELVACAGGDGALVGAWRWNSASRAWAELAVDADELRVEVGTAIDPIRIGAAERGYLQVDIDHTLSTLDASCDGNLFVRLWNDDPPRRAFGDDDDELFECRVPTDALGDPIVLRQGECSQDSECPAQGECVDGECRFSYECTGDADCPADATCSRGACMRDGAGTGGTGGAGGAGGASGAAGASGSTGSGGSAGAMAPPGNVQGGAFNCAATTLTARDRAWLPLSAALIGLLLGRRLRRRSRSDARGRI